VQRQSIEDWFANMEDVLYGRTAIEWNDPIDGYAKYIDVDNFIDYFILNNLSKNGDGLLLSFWLYNPDPNNGGKLKFGPPWDYDLGAFEGNPASNTNYRADRLWYDRLFDDPAFRDAYDTRWQMWRQSILSESGMNAVFDTLVDEIGEDAIVRDGVPILDGRINTVKRWLASRVAAIDNATGGPAIVADRTSGAWPLTVQFTEGANITNESEWLWDFGDGQTSNQRNPTHVYTTPGFFDVSLRVTGSNGQHYDYFRSEFIAAILDGDVNMNGSIEFADITQFIENWRADTSRDDEVGKIMKGDLNRDGTTDLLDWHILRVAWNSQGGRPLNLDALLNGRGMSSIEKLDFASGSDEAPVFLTSSQGLDRQSSIFTHSHLLTERRRDRMHRLAIEEWAEQLENSDEFEDPPRIQRAPSFE
jgi:hypothetical protein